MAQTASKQYIVEPTDPSQIQALTFVTTLGTFGTTTIKYKKVGNLYFDIWATNTGALNFAFGSGAGGTLSDAEVTLDQIAFLLGVTINTYYDSTNNGATLGVYSAGTWSEQTGSGVDVIIINAFLSN